jgi:hypothetical protein
MSKRYTRQWLRPMKLREYYVDLFVPNVRDAEHQLYWAVVEGNIRARHSGHLLTPEEAYALREKRWSLVEGDLYALPPDLELSVEDAKRIWMEVALPESPTRTLVQADESQPESHHKAAPALERARRAIKELYLDDVPDQSNISNKRLCAEVLAWLEANKQEKVGDDTILRAAGRRK